MASIAANKLSFVLVLFVIFAYIASTNGNWYGKRGDKVDDTLFQLLEGNVPGLLDRQIDAQMTLRSIGKLISDYQVRQLQHEGAKGGTK